MWRISLGLVCVVLAIVSANARADSAGVTGGPPSDVAKILLEAQATAHEIKSPVDRNSALNAVGQTLIRAGDEGGALAINKKLVSNETPRPILKSLALAQLHAGRADDALFTVRSMNDQEASDQSLIDMAQAAEDAGDAEMAVRMCKLVAGPARLDALLLAARIQHKAADVEGVGASLDAAKLLAHHQAEVAKVAETEALLGNLDRADKLMSRLRREYDQSRVLAAIVSVEAAAKDFASADSHASDITTDTYKSVALAAIGLAHAEVGQMKEAIEQVNAISEDDVRLSTQRTLTTRELKNHGVDAGRTVAMACHDAAGKAVCLSLVALAADKAGNAELAKKTMTEAREKLFPEHELPSDPAVAAVAENLARLDMADAAITLAEKIRDSDARTDAVRAVIRLTTLHHDAETSRKLLEVIKDPRERAAGLVGIAEGMLDKSDAAQKAS